MLGIWPERYQAYQISVALKEAGIGTRLSGHIPCIINVEYDKLGQAYRIASSHPSWMRDARISGAADPIHDVTSGPPGDR